MKKIRYGVAMSLDGYIAGPKGEAEWIVHDPEVNFVEIWAQYDIGLMGRGTYAPAVARLGKNAFQGMKVVVVSRTMRQEEHPGISVINELTRQRVRALRDEAKKDIWLFGGGELFRSMLELGEVDGIDVAVMPVVLGGGIPFLPCPAREAKLTLTKHRIYTSGMVSLSYEVQR